MFVRVSKLFSFPGRRIQTKGFLHQDTNTISRQKGGETSGRSKNYITTFHKLYSSLIEIRVMKSRCTGNIIRIGRWEMDTFQSGNINYKRSFGKSRRRREIRNESQGADCISSLWYIDHWWDRVTTMMNSESPNRLEISLFFLFACLFVCWIRITWRCCQYLRICRVGGLQNN
jgi:hypothetical protein